MAAWIAFALGAGAAAARIGLAIGMWWLLTPLFMVVGHRMIPFFSASALPRYEAYRPDWTLRLLLAVSALHGALTMAAFGLGTLPCPPCLANLSGRA